MLHLVNYNWLKKIDYKYTLLLVIQIVLLCLFLNQAHAKQPVATVITHNGANGYTPIKGIDYFDGINGKNSLSRVITVEKPTTIVTPIQIPTKTIDPITPIPCSVENKDGGAKFTCPDGTTASIELPVVKNGDTPEVWVQNCQLMVKYPSDDEPTPKGNVCEQKDAVTQ